MTGTPDLSVVVCSYNRADRLGATLQALEHQTIRDRLEIVIVDDASDPAIDRSQASRVGTKLIRHASNQGPATACNTGAAASLAPVVAFTDDDCRPGPEWASSLLSAYDDPNVVAAGGPVVGSGRTRYLERYFACKQPFGPLEATLGRSSSLVYRLWLYGHENIAPAWPPGSVTRISWPGRTSRSGGRSSRPSVDSMMPSAPERTATSATDCTFYSPIRPSA